MLGSRGGTSMKQSLAHTIKCLAHVGLFLSVLQAHGARLANSEHFQYEVLFTNPQCEDYFYGTDMYSNYGDRLEKKVKNVYCTFRDAQVSAMQDSSPQKRLQQWIQDSETKEIFMTYLSFSNSRIRDSLCRAIKERDLKLTFVLDHPTPYIGGNILAESRKALQYPVDKDVYQVVLGHDKMKAAKYILRNCRAKNKDNNPTLYLRGHVSGINWSHNKLVIVNPDSEDKIRIVFSSGNLSSGIVLHHENWHFITTSVDTYFSKIHLCLKDAMLWHTSSRKAFERYISDCRTELSKNNYEEESDIKVFLVPAGEGILAFKSIQRSLQQSSSIGVAAHRFSYSFLINLFSKYLQNDKDLRLVVDDDIYWAFDPTYKSLKRPNNSSEKRKVDSLVRDGASVRYMQTNHWDNLLHHNKFIVFFSEVDGSEKAFAAFAGAGNFTSTAFGVAPYPANLENFYLIKIPAVVEKMAEQYNYMWNNLASTARDMPKRNVSGRRYR